MISILNCHPFDVIDSNCGSSSTKIPLLVRCDKNLLFIFTRKGNVLQFDLVFIGLEKLGKTLRKTHEFWEKTSRFLASKLNEPIFNTGFFDRLKNSRMGKLKTHENN